MPTGSRRSAVPTTRAVREPDTETTPAETEAAERENIHDFVARVEETLRDRLTAHILTPGRIQAVVDDEYGNRLRRLDEACSTISQGQKLLRQEFEKFREEPCKTELQSLRDELVSIRSYVNGECQKLWRELNKLKGEGPREPSPEREPETVPDEDDPPAHLRKGRGSKATRSRNSRAKGSHSSRRKHRRKERYESETESSDSSDESDDDLNDPDGDEIRVADKECRKVLNVETYRLVDRDAERDLALRTTKVLANLRHLFDGERFDGTDPLTVLPFLEELKATFDDAGLCEGDAKHMIRYFLTGEAARLFKGLSPRDKKSYPRIVKWLLRTYVRESMLQNAREAFLTRAQKSTETELEYSQALSSLAKRCAGMIPAKDLINRFIRGLRPAIRTQVQSRMAKNTSWAVAVAIATDHGNAHREAQKEQESRRDPAFTTFPRRRNPVGKGKVLALRHQMRDDGSEPEELWTPEEDPAIFDARDNTIGAIHRDSSLIPRDDSYASLLTSNSSSSERYYTPRTSFIGRESQERPLADPSKRVMLPPGVPYPAKRPQATQPASRPRTTSAVNALPCLGCGKLGHWLADCLDINPRLKDLALDSLRARKQARKIKFDERRDPSPGRFRAVLPVETEEDDAPAEADEQEQPAEETG